MRPGCACIALWALRSRVALDASIALYSAGSASVTLDTNIALDASIALAASCAGITFLARNGKIKGDILIVGECSRAGNIGHIKCVISTTVSVAGNGINKEICISNRM